MAATVQRSTPELPHHALPCDHGQRRRVITESLLADVFQGRLIGGQHLVIHDLAARYDVSPTPIREALVALEGLGVVEFFPNRGAVVRRLSATDVREICQVRRALECEAVRLATGRIEAEELAALAEDCRRIQSAHRPTVRVIERSKIVDSRLHDLIAERCGNRLLSQEINRLKLLFRAFRDTAWQRCAAIRDHHRLVEEAIEHQEIVEYLRIGNRSAAVRSMARHIDGGLKYWTQALPDS